MGGVDNEGFDGIDTMGRKFVKKEVLTEDNEHILSKLYKANRRYIDAVGLAVLFAGYNAYFVYCIARHYMYDIPIWSCGENCTEETQNDATEPFWCNSLAFLIVLTSLTYAGLLYGYILKPLFGKRVHRIASPWLSKISKLLENRWVNISAYLVVIGGILAYLIVNSISDTRRLVSIGGYFIFLAIGWLFSIYPRKVLWKQVAWGLGIQFAFAMIVIKWSFGKDLINCLSSKVKTFLSYSDVGAEMIYGYLVTGKLFNPENYYNNTELDLTVRGVMGDINDSGSITDSGMMFKVLSMIYFLSFFVSMLYYLGVLQAIVLKLGWLLSKTVGTTAAESTNAAANIFLGQTEAPLLIKPFLPVMTKSEIHAVMTGGFATIAGTVLGAYIGMGVDANNLITASVMAAPTALAVSKLFYPETEESKTTIKDLKVENEDDANVLDAAAKGASTAIGLVLNIAASLIAFKSFVAFLDALIGWFGGFAGKEDLSFQIILGYLFWPLPLIMGVRVEDCLVVAKLIGMKLLVTEFPAFDELGKIKNACGMDETSDKCTLEERSITICTFALCGFANFASIGMQIGGLSGLCPERKSDFAQVVFRAMIAGCWVSFLNACIAGALL